MARARQKKLDLVSAKQHAPNVPGDTCPTINYVQEMLDQLIDRNREDTWSLTQRDVINNALEYVRSANQELRDSSKYWYDQCKKVA
tara:strand:+ start:836 stop:1093 length:258 start_codon:yes stop_codon:yes gene_type:complete